MQYRFVTVDVFATRPFTGNPLAVILDADGLGAEQMQRIAAEFNLAETTFVFPSRQKGRTTFKARIFTPRTELAFGGHPLLGAAFAVALDDADHPDATTIVLETNVGPVEIELLVEEKIVGARIAAPHAFAIEDALEPDIVAEMCSIRPTDIEIRNHPPCLASCGIRFAYGEVKSLGALRAASADHGAFNRNLPRDKAVGVQLYLHVNEATSDVRTRVFAPLFGLPEDPATGGANLGLIGLLADLNMPTGGRLKRRISQGSEMGRPSLIDAEAEVLPGKVNRLWVGGQCNVIMQGIINV